MCGLFGPSQRVVEILENIECELEGIQRECVLRNLDRATCTDQSRLARIADRVDTLTPTTFSQATQALCCCNLTGTLVRLVPLINVNIDCRALLGPPCLNTYKPLESLKFLIAFVHLHHLESAWCALPCLLFTTACITAPSDIANLD